MGDSDISDILMDQREDEILEEQRFLQKRAIGNKGDISALMRRWHELQEELELLPSMA